MNKSPDIETVPKFNTITELEKLAKASSNSTHIEDIGFAQLEAYSLNDTYLFLSYSDKKFLESRNPDAIFSIHTNVKSVIQMSFGSSNHYLVGKAIIDFIERIPKGYTILAHNEEQTMSFDSYWIYLSAIEKYRNKLATIHPRFENEYLVVNYQGRYNQLNNTEDEKLILEKINSKLHSCGIEQTPKYIAIDEIQNYFPHRDVSEANLSRIKPFTEGKVLLVPKITLIKL